MTRARRTHHRGQRGLTILEVMVATAILTMVATMIWAAFDQTGKMRAKLSTRQETDHLARVAMSRITRDLRAAFLTLHANNVDQRLVTVVAQFIGTSHNGSSRVDFTAFTHRRLVANAHEGDASEVGYRVEEHRAEGGGRGWDLMRREATRPDTDPARGGVMDVLMPSIRRFELRYYDDVADQWKDTWDTTQATGELTRLPQRVRVSIIVEDPSAASRERTYSTETQPMITRPLTFGLPIY